MGPVNGVFLDYFLAANNKIAKNMGLRGQLGLVIGRVPDGKRTASWTQTGIRLQ
jgi:hypothetical protein